MTKFAQDGNRFMLAGGHPPNIIDTLPPGNFVVRVHEKLGFYLQQTDNFVLPPRLYGAFTRQRDRIVGTFKDRPAATGALFSGEKGSGKTLLAKMIANKLAEEGMPTLLVNAAYKGDEFYSFLEAIQQPCAVFFDEFEKVYDNEEGKQDGLLTLLDGIFPTRKLFMLTCNDKWKINSHMKNRPGRIFYAIEFSGVERSLIEEYAEANLREPLKQYIPKLVSLGKSFDKFNFDMLKATVEEMNRYCEEPKDALTMLNIKPDGFNQARYAVQIFKGTEEIPQAQLSAKTWRGDPEHNMYAHFGYSRSTRSEEEIEQDKVRKSDENDTEYKRRLHKLTLAVMRGGEHTGFEISAEHFVGINHELRCLVYENEGHRLHLTKIETPTYEVQNHYSML